MPYPHLMIMASFSYGYFHLQALFLGLALLFLSRGVSSATFTFVNKCEFTVWPGILSSAGSPMLETTGFELKKGGLRSLQAPSSWSGRFWGRSGCSFDDSGHGSCVTADCGSGEIECNGGGAAPPATLAEFTLGGSGSQDFYDVSLVDGYNLPLIIEGTGLSGSCQSTGCVTDLNRRCPAELRVNGGAACKSACEAFGSPEYCCSGAYSTPSACKPSPYSQMFKAACPRSYSYAYDDATSTFTCSGADYTITFCPNSPSIKSARDPSTIGTQTADSSATSGPGLASGTGSGSNPIQDTAYGNSWLANLATGDSTGTLPSWTIRFTLAFAVAFSLSFNFFVA